MNSSAIPPDPLDDLLRQKPAPLRDAEFTANVMRALPAPATQVNKWTSTRPVFITAAALIGVAYAGWRADWRSLQTDVQSLQVPFAQVGAELAQPPVMLALVVAALSVLYALAAPSLHRRP